jgi:hypothetical protein
MIDLIGWVGGLMLSWCGLPLASMVVRQGHAKGLSRAFIGLWGGGEILTLIYVLVSREGVDGPLVFNYLTNLIFIGIIVYYMLKERESGQL